MIPDDKKEPEGLRKMLNRIWTTAYLKRFTIWRYRHLSLRQFVILSSIVIGLIAGFSSVILKNFTHYIQQFVQGIIIDRYGFDAYYFVFPVIGIYCTYLIIRYVIRRPVGHGIPDVLRSISRKKSILPFRSVYSSLLTAPITVGFGGSAGLEGPAVGTGAAIGSNFATLLHLNPHLRSLLLGCGAAAALSAVFKVPITGVIFVIEVFSLDLTMASLIPLMLSSATGLMVSYFFMGQDLTLNVASVVPFQLGRTYYYALLAIVASLISISFLRINDRVNKFFKEKTKGPYTRIIWGGIIIGTLLFVMPTIYGEGYSTINSLLSGDYHSVTDFEWVTHWFGSDYNSVWIPIAILVVMLYLKMIATSVTFGAGGIGGTFAPTLFMGSVVGFAFALIVNTLIPSANLPVVNFTLAGMTAMMTGVMQAPLTAVFLITETTDGYALIGPLMVASAISYVITRAYTKYSIYTKELVERGEMITHDKDRTVLGEIDMEKVVETDFTPVSIDMNLGEITRDVVAKSTRNVFPVLSKSGRLLGVIPFDDIRPVMFDTKYYEIITAESLMLQPPQVILYGVDTAEQVMEKFQETGAWNLPVVEGNHMHYKGFISRSKLLSVYRRKMADHNTEFHLFGDR